MQNADLSSYYMQMHSAIGLCVDELIYTSILSLVRPNVATGPGPALLVTL